MNAENRGDITFSFQQQMRIVSHWIGLFYRPEILVFLLLLPLINCSTGRQGGLDHFEEISSGKQLNTLKLDRVEEIFSSDRNERIGFLEVKKREKSGTPDHMNVYHVYGPLYEAPGKGFILESGAVYKQQANGSRDFLGNFPFRKGVKKLLDYEGRIQFYRFGERVRNR